MAEENKEKNGSMTFALFHTPFAVTPTEQGLKRFQDQVRAETVVVPSNSIDFNVQYGLNISKNDSNSRLLMGSIISEDPPPADTRGNGSTRARFAVLRKRKKIVRVNRFIDVRKNMAPFVFQDLKSSQPSSVHAGTNVTTEQDKVSPAADPVAKDVVPLFWGFTHKPRPYYFKNPAKSRSSSVFSNLGSATMVMYKKGQKDFPTGITFTEQQKNRLALHTEDVAIMKRCIDEKKMLRKTDWIDGCPNLKAQDTRIFLLMASSLAYYFQSGPFIRTWVVYGYNPTLLKTREYTSLQQGVNMKITAEHFGMYRWGNLSDIFDRGVKCHKTLVKGFSFMSIETLAHSCPDLQEFLNTVTLLDIFHEEGRGWYKKKDFDKIKAISIDHCVRLLREALKPGELTLALSTYKRERKLSDRAAIRNRQLVANSDASRKRKKRAPVQKAKRERRPPKQKVEETPAVPESVATPFRDMLETVDEFDFSM